MARVDVLQDWAPVASAGLAAMAAGAAWWNVRQSRRQWLQAQRPLIVPQVVDNGQKQRIELRLLNAGVGSARGLRFCLVLGDEYVSGYAGPNLGGVLKADEARVIQTDLTSRRGRPAGVIVYLDSAERIHVVDFEGNRRTRHARRDVVRGTDPDRWFKKLYSRSELDGKALVGARASQKSPSS